MTAVTVLLALLAALSNASASVLQRRAAVQEPDQGGGAGAALRRLTHLLRRPNWLAGTGLLALSSVLQGGALATGSLSLVQPLLAAELLFTLVVGSVVFRRAPDRRTWLAFAALAVGLALFLVAASPSAGRPTASPRSWLVGGSGALGAVVLLTVAARPTRGASRAALFGLASAVSFATTAALLKEAVGQLGQGPGAMFGHWALYATGAAGLVAFLLLQSALGAGSLTASQPALTLGDAVTSVILGWVLFDEVIQLGLRVIPEVIGIGLIGAGSIGLARASDDGQEWDTHVRDRGDRGDRKRRHPNRAHRQDATPP
ncbi:membrane protein [Streptomyces filipinensis]|uniref:Membrane protein n=1 Tax=Streptomyces filipinensis TaxID=66887 RepID=A0A918MEM3_9ACTN|nr:DMT family transporter [Streptomyces filipinensis]GGV14530.1 membrane protein [Streptomyces filipinensis]